MQRWKTDRLWILAARGQHATTRCMTRLACQGERERERESERERERERDIIEDLWHGVECGT